MSAEQQAPCHSPPLKLLSLDGGGIRGMSSLIILKYLMKRVRPENPPKPCEYFDLIGGTSTGGLIALMLGRLCMDVDTCIGKYCELSSLVFQPKRAKVNLLARWKDYAKADGAYRSEHLEAEVKKMVEEIWGDEQAKLLQPGPNLGSRVFVCAFTKSGTTPARLRSYTTDDSVDSLSGSGCAIWEAARATSAAATFFDPIKIGRQQYVDGGTGYNNPVEAVLEEAKSIWPDAASRIQCLVSIGTGVPDPKDFGDNLKEVIETLKDIATETETTEQKFFANHTYLGLGGRYFRFNVDKGLDGVGLDEHEKMDKIESATERYLNGHRVKQQVEALVSARAPLNSPCNAATKESYLAFLACIDPLKHHNQARACRTTKNTGAWFLRGEFDKWKIQPRSFLWLHAQAGAGKTVLTSSIIDEIEQQRLGTMAYFYFSFKEQQSQDIHRFKHTILTQLVRRLTRPDLQVPGRFYVPPAFRQLFYKYFPSTNPLMEDLDDTLEKVLQESEETYLVIDGLDECPSPSDREDIIAFLGSLSRSLKSNIHTLITSRQDVDIETAIKYLPNNKTIVPFETSKIDEDIRAHIVKRLAREPYRSWSEDLKRKVIDYLTKHAGGIFRWADLQLGELEGKAREKDIDQTLAGLPKDLEQIYERILQCIDQRGYAREAKAILTWLAYSPVPLTLGQVMEIAMFQTAERNQSDADDHSAMVSVEPGNRFPDPLWIRRILSSLVTISCKDDQPPVNDDEENITPERYHDVVVSLAHASVKDYLEIANVTPQCFRINEKSGQWFIFNGCLAYVDHYDETNTGSPDLKPSTFQQYPLLDYVCRYWPRFALEFLNQQDKNARKQVTARLKQRFTTHHQPGSTLSARLILPVAPAMGDRRLVKLLIKAGVDVNVRSATGGTVLHAAARKNDSEIVRLLLRHNAKVNVRDENGHTPLIAAIENRSEEIVSLLVQAGADTTGCVWDSNWQSKEITLFPHPSYDYIPRFVSNPLDPENETRRMRHYLVPDLTVAAMVLLVVFCPSVTLVSS